MSLLTRRVFPALPLVFLAGCMPFNGPGDVRRDIQASTGMEFDRTFGMTVGRMGMGIARWAVRQSDETDIPLEGIRKVEIGVYDITETGDRSILASGAGALWPEWSSLVEVHDDGEDVLVMSQRQDGSMRRLLFVIHGGDEMVLVRVTGDLEPMIEQVIRYALTEVDRPEVVEPVLEEYRGHPAP